jgi:ABC-type multidrug transport system fused ATPase/permease subunit
MRDLIRKFCFLLSAADRRHLLVLYVLTILGSILEALGVGAIPAFIILINDTKAISKYPIVQQLFRVDFGSGRELFLWAALGLILLFVLKNAYLSLLAYAKNRFLFNRAVDLSTRLFRAYLLSPYTFHLQTNSAALVRNVSSEVHQALTAVLMPTLDGAMELLVIAFIVCMLLVVEPVACLFALVLVASAYGIYASFFRKRLSQHGKQQQDARRRMVQDINQGIGGFRDARILGREEYFVNALNGSATTFARAGHFQRVAADLPRRFMEIVAVLGMLLIALVLLKRSTDIQSVVPRLALFAVAAVRLMPSVNRVSEAVSSIRFARYSVDIIYADLINLEKQAIASTNTGVTLPLHRSIEIKGVHYRYPGTHKDALKDVSLTIHKGNVVGLVGSSGAGKTTLANLILGLLEPTAGVIAVDGVDTRTNMRSWQRNTAYVPQTIYLADDTVRRNIAFGLQDSDIDLKKLESAIRAAHLESVIESLPKGLDTVVGERGVRLSGGQRQRIAIARAIYHDPELLVMDEATSSLDNETEQYVIEAIEFMKRTRTIIMIAHRLSTVRQCDELVFIKNGSVQARGTYQTLAAENVDFQTMVALTAKP